MLFFPFAKTESLGTATLPKWLEARPASGVSVGVSGTSSLKRSARCMILFETSDIVDGKPINGCHGISWSGMTVGMVHIGRQKMYGNLFSSLQNFPKHVEATELQLSPRICCALLLLKSWQICTYFVRLGKSLSKVAQILSGWFCKYEVHRASGALWIE